MEQDQFIPVKFKRSELEELELMVRRQGFKSVREMLLVKAGMRYVDNRRSDANRIRGAGIEPASTENYELEILLDGGTPMFRKQIPVQVMTECYVGNTAWKKENQNVTIH